MAQVRGFSSSVSSRLLVRGWTEESRQLASRGGSIRQQREGRFLSAQARYMHSVEAKGGEHLRQDNILTSTKGNTVKHIQSLLKKSKKRTECGQTIVEGPRMVLDLLNDVQTRRLVRQILVDDAERLRGHVRDDDDIFVQVASPQVLKACSDTVTNQGMIAVVDLPDAGIDWTTPTTESPLFLILDGVSDPGNVGTLLRSSLAVGVSAVILLPGSCDAWNPKAVRSAMSASFQVPIASASSWDDALQMLPSTLTTVFASTMSHGKSPSMPHYEVPWNGSPSALVIGSEGTGLSQAVRDDIERGTNESSGVSIQAVHVPMQENSIESLNAAVCGSVILFEYSRQRNSSRGKND